MRRVILMLLLAAALFLSMPVQLSAQTTSGPINISGAGTGGKLKFGNLSIIPSLGIQGIYDDNIYLGNGKEYPGDAATTLAERKTSDWITHVMPGLMLNYTLPQRGSLSLGYRGDWAFYNKETSNNWKNNQGFVAADYLAPSGIILGISDTYTKAEDPYGSADQYNVGRVTKRAVNDLKAKAGYHLMNNFRALVLYNNYYQKYDNDQLDFSQDYYYSEYWLSVETRILPKTWGFVRYLYGQQNYTTNAPGQTDQFNSDFKRHSIQTGLTWDPGAKLSGEVNFGYQWQKYDHEFTDAAHTARRGDENNWTAATSVNFQATAATMLSMNLTRAVRNTASDTSERYVDTGISLNLQQLLLRKLSLLAGVGYSKNEYNLPANDPRTDNNYLANVGLVYKIRDWVDVGAGYFYNRKNSNIEINDYTDNKLQATLNMRY